MGLSAADIKNVRGSWGVLVEKAGLQTIGIVVLQGLFNDAPATRQVFAQMGITKPAEQAYIVEELVANERVLTHAQKLAETIDGLLKVLENTDAVVEACTELGQAHALVNVTPEHVDILGPILLKVICANLGVPLTCDAAKSWGTLYGIVGACMKDGMK